MFLVQSLNCLNFSGDVTSVTSLKLILFIRCSLEVSLDMLSSMHVLEILTPLVMIKYMFCYCFWVILKCQTHFINLFLIKYRKSYKILLRRNWKNWHPHIDVIFDSDLAKNHAVGNFGHWPVRIRQFQSEEFWRNVIFLFIIAKYFNSIWN